MAAGLAAALKETAEVVVEVEVEVEVEVDADDDDEAFLGVVAALCGSTSSKPRANPKSLN